MSGIRDANGLDACPCGENTVNGVGCIVFDETEGLGGRGAMVVWDTAG